MTPFGEKVRSAARGTARAWNYFGGGASPAEIEIEEKYAYNGRGGGVSAKTTEAFFDAASQGLVSQAFTWNELGALESMDYPTWNAAPSGLARTVTMGYTMGLLTSVQPWAPDINYHGNLALASVVHANGVTDLVDEDSHEMSRPARIRTTGVQGGLDWDMGSFKYDGSGNVKAIGVDQFAYDAGSRLVEARLWVPDDGTVSSTTPSFDDGFDKGNACRWEIRIPDPGCPPVVERLGVESYSYDHFGNLISQVRDGTLRNIPADPATNRLSTANYDERGNLVTQFAENYTWDLLNRMTAYAAGDLLPQGVQRTELYAYNVDGERVVSLDYNGSGDKTWTFRDLSGKVVRQYHQAGPGGPFPNPNVDETPVWDRDWAYRGGQLLATEDATGTIHLTLDHLGTPRLMTDASGARVAYHAYWPYGEEASDPSQDTLSLKYTGHERDQLSGLDYMHARYRSPLTTRFTSVDAHRGLPRKPRSWNRYAYAQLNPLALVDPTGNVVILANRPTDLDAGWHAFIIVQLTGANRTAFRSRAENGRVFLSGLPGVVEGKDGQRLVKNTHEHFHPRGKTQLIYIQPKGQTMEQFERNVIAAWDSYVDGSELYINFGFGAGKNSNSLASGVLDAAGAGDAKPSSWDLEGDNWGWNNPVKLAPTHVASVFYGLSVGAAGSTWTDPLEQFVAGQAILEGVQFAPGRSR